MAQQEHHAEIARSIDLQLSDNENISDIRYAPGGGSYETWYATMLSAIALIAAGEKVVYAYTNYEFSAPHVRIVVFTTSLVLVSDVDIPADRVPVVHAVARRSLTALHLSASERIDSRDHRSRTWPGVLNLVLTYDGLADPIEIVTKGYNRYGLDIPAAVATLLDGLRADLAGSATR